MNSMKQTNVYDMDGQKNVCFVKKQKQDYMHEVFRLVIEPNRISKQKLSSAWYINNNKKNVLKSRKIIAYDTA